MPSKVLTVSFGSIFQAEGDGEHGIILKKLCGERVPPQVVTILAEEAREWKPMFYKFGTIKEHKNSSK